MKLNLKQIGLAATAASQAAKYLKSQGDKRERDIYQSLLDNLKGGDLDDIHDKLDIDELEELYGAARAHAGDITRDAHDRLDRRRAAFAAAAPSRKERQEFLESYAKPKKKKKKGAGNVIKLTLGTAALAGAGWAAWEFWLKDKLNSDEPVKTYRPAPTRTETDPAGNSTIVYSTRTEDARESGIEGGVFPVEPSRDDATSGTSRLITGTGAGAGSAAGSGSDDELRPLDDQLTTLDTLDDNQRKATESSRSVEDAADAGRHELK